MTVRLVLADDHTVVLQGLTALLALEPDIEVVALCRDGEEAVEAVALHRPDVVVMDASMPRCGGLDARERLLERGLTVPTVVLSATMDDATLGRCLELSVEGIVLKESAASVLVDAIRAASRGERWIPPVLSARALDLMARTPAKAEDALTPRERDIVLQVASGKSNKRVASELGIAESTVKLHLHSAFTKLGVANRVQLSLLARERGWI
ncbi:MAG TPA: response regulator transcription factor [Longimicrobiales bacterium]|nr:response regulator transcription factor [Longimicrobiales bacterium]